MGGQFGRAKPRLPERAPLASHRSGFGLGIGDVADEGEGGFRQMKTTGLQTRPIYHWRPHRIIAHVKLCVLALRLERAAEIRCQQTWRTIRQTLDQLPVVRYRMHGKTIVQSTQVTASMAEILQRLGIPLPKKILAVDE